MLDNATQGRSTRTHPLYCNRNTVKGAILHVHDVNARCWSRRCTQRGPREEKAASGEHWLSLRGPPVLRSSEWCCLAAVALLKPAFHRLVSTGGCEPGPSQHGGPHDSHHSPPPPEAGAHGGGPSRNGGGWGQVGGGGEQQHPRVLLEGTEEKILRCEEPDLKCDTHTRTRACVRAF